jgi:hypothetical protein
VAVNEIPGPVPWLEPDRLEEQRRRLPASSFARLFLNQWTAAEDRLVDPDEYLRAGRGCLRSLPSDSAEPKPAFSWFEGDRVCVFGAVGRSARGHPAHALEGATAVAAGRRDAARRAPECAVAGDLAGGASDGPRSGPARRPRDQFGVGRSSFARGSQRRRRNDSLLQVSAGAFADGAGCAPVFAAWGGRAAHDAGRPLGFWPADLPSFPIESYVSEPVSTGRADWGKSEFGAWLHRLAGCRGARAARVAPSACRTRGVRVASGFGPQKVGALSPGAGTRGWAAHCGSGSAHPRFIYRRKERRS